jgi:predicted membrane chloride channel (bestrophin family)
MIVKPKELGFFKLLLEMSGSVVPAIMPKIMFATGIGLFACLALSLDLFGENTSDVLSLEFGPFTALGKLCVTIISPMSHIASEIDLTRISHFLILFNFFQGVAISLFLGFHNNASYGRWWEARIVWGKQIIVTRDLSRFLAGVMDEHDNTIYDPVDKEDVFKARTAVIEIQSSNSSFSENADKKDLENQPCIDWGGSIHNPNSSPKRNDANASKYASWQAHIICLSVAHSHAFRYQMRPICKMDGRVTALHDRNRFLNFDEQKKLLKCKNNANTILLFMSKILGKAHSAGKIDTYSMIHVQKIIDSMCFMQTAAERIQNTSLPLAYSLLVYRTSILYVLLVPFAIAPTIGWWTPLFTAIVAYTFFGLDELAKEIQEPFRDRPMCLALSAMCRTIEIDALEVLGEDAPPFLKPTGNVLM